MKNWGVFHCILPLKRENFLLIGWQQMRKGFPQTKSTESWEITGNFVDKMPKRWCITKGGKKKKKKKWISLKNTQVTFGSSTTSSTVAFSKFLFHLQGPKYDSHKEVENKEGVTIRGCK